MSQVYNFILMQEERENQSYWSTNNTSKNGRQALKNPGLTPFLNLLAKQHHSFGTADYWITQKSPSKCAIVGEDGEDEEEAEEQRVG